MEDLYLLGIWLAIIVIATIIEFVSLQMVSIWFVIGGLVSLILYFCGVSLDIQIIVFFAVSIVLLCALRKICLKILTSKKPQQDTGTDLHTGEKATLVSPIIQGQGGSIKLGDVVWSVFTEDKADIDVNQEVEVIAIKGNKMLVKKIEKENN